MRVSVRTLVEFMLRSGDIDDRKQSGGDPDSMLEGQRIHKMLQKSATAGYRAEVTFREIFEQGSVRLTVEGRADGVWTGRHEGGYEGPTHVIDEIKGTYDDLSYYDAPKELHMAQCRCYAAMYMRELGDECPDEIGAQVTYCNIETEDVRRFMYIYRYDELREWFEELVGRYMIWCEMDAEHIRRRTGSISGLEFPFTYRAGQRKLVSDVYRVIRMEKNLFIQAPTGTGKTLSVLYPSIQAMGTGLVSKIFYLTAKTMTASVAVGTMELLGGKGLDCRSVHITARERSCINDECACNPDACPYARGHFDRVNDAMYDILTHEHMITQEILAEYAGRHMVCPYEYALDISDWCDVIIGDYNYAFDPRVKLKRYFGENEPKQRKYVFLVDEAHNLVDRACGMYSASIIKENVLECVRMVGDMDKKLATSLRKLNKQMKSVKRSFDDCYMELPSDEIQRLVSTADTVILGLAGLLGKYKFFDNRDEVLTFYLNLKTFADTWYGDTSGYRYLARVHGDGSFEIRLLCIDPSAHLRQCLKSCRSAVFFSATLLPVNYYKELLTGDTQEYAVYAETVFTQSQRLLLQATDVSSKYTRRNALEYEKIAGYITDTAAVRKGNYMAFFPSYDFMRQVGDIIARRAFEQKSGLTIITQEQGMSEKDRNAFLAEFEKEHMGSLLGMCVLGGIFAEGIDLTDDRLVGAFIVGTGLPMINPESEIAREYFNSRGRDGFAYAYLYPGMNKVLQAAGRVIRKETDRGIILLLDERFSQAQYRSIFPLEWNDCALTTAQDAAAQAAAFWDNEICLSSPVRPQLFHSSTSISSCSRP